jgi:hypothetical protein
MKAKIGFIVLTAITFPCSVLNAKTIKIPVDYPKIQTGIDAAVNGDIVLVADGIYESTDDKNTEVVNFKGKKIVVRSENGPKNCILKRGNDVVRFNSGETHSSILDGFTVTGSDPGAAIECYNSSPTIRNNIFCNNWSEYNLGAVYFDNSSAVLMNNVFYGNDVYGTCAGVVCWDSSSITITNNTFFGQPADISWNSGFVGVLCDSTSSATITNCIFWHTGPLDFKRCTISFSCIDKEITGTHNKYTYPEFMDTLARDFSLKIYSTSVDAGTEDTTGLNLPSFDILGRNRISNLRIDIGAYEYTDEVRIRTIEKPAIEIYPIPSNGILYFEFSRLEGTTVMIEVYNPEGKKILSTTFEKVSKSTIDLTGNPKGVYILRIKTGSEQLYKKICLQ